MIHLSKHPEYRFYHHPKSESYFLAQEEDIEGASFEAGLCHEVKVSQVPREQLENILRGFIVPNTEQAKDLFDSYKRLGDAIKQLGFVVQNPGMCLGHNEFVLWTQAAMEVRSTLDLLIRKTATLIKSGE